MSLVAGRKLGEGFWDKIQKRKRTMKYNCTVSLFLIGNSLEQNRKKYFGAIGKEAD